MMRWRNRAGMIALLMTLSACASSPAPNLYRLALPLEGDTRPLPAGASLTPSLAILPIGLPSGLDRPQWVVQSASGQVRLLDGVRWSAPLRQDIPVALAGRLGDRLNSRGVVALPRDVQALNPDYRVSLDVQRLDLIEDTGLWVDIAWQLIPRDGQPIFGRTVHRLPLAGTAPEQWVATYGLALNHLADDLAAALRGVSP